jgi:hypothetical protein
MKRLFCILIIVLTLCSITTTVYAVDMYNETESIVYVENTPKSGSDTDSAWIPDMTSIVITILVSGGISIGLVVSHNKANKKISATNYVAENGYKVNSRNEQYVKTYDTVQKNFYGSNQNK